MLASRHLKQTTSIPPTIISTHIPGALKTPPPHQVLIVTRTNADKLIHVKEACTIGNISFKERTTLSSYHLFKAAAILTLYKYLTEGEHKHQKLPATSLEQLPPSIQAFLQALDVLQLANR